MTTEDKKDREGSPVTPSQLYREAQDHAASQNPYDVRAGLDRFTGWMQGDVTGAAPQAVSDAAPANRRSRPVPQSRPRPPQHDLGMPGMAAAIAAADPMVRMALRRSPVILAVILSDLLVRALVIADAAADYPHQDREIAADLERADAINSEINYFNLDEIDKGEAHGRYVAIGRALDRARTLAHGHSRDLALSIADDLVVVTRSALSSTRQLAQARALTVDPHIDLIVDLAGVLAMGILGLDGDYTDDDDNLDVASARELAHHVASAVGRTLGVRQVEGLAAALLDGVLDDFTRADLAHADLTGLDLTGVRWSVSGTQWPPGTDVDALLARSREVVPSIGIYVITSPGPESEALLYSPV